MAAHVLLSLLLVVALDVEPSAVPAPSAYHFPSGEAPARALAIDLPPKPIAVWFPAAEPLPEAEAQVRRLHGFLAQLPTAHVATLHTIAFDPREYPFNAKKGVQLGQPELKLWASARAGVMTFYRNDPPGEWKVSRRRVFHELAHCVAHQAFGSSTPPAAYKAAVQQDGTFFSDYSRKAYGATGSLVEDFADAYAAWMQAQIDGGEAQVAFERDYAARGRALAALLPLGILNQNTSNP
jgi:hypothetical protein